MLIEADKSALLLIDVQTKLIPTIEYGDSFIENCAWVLNLAKELAIPSFAVEHYPSGLGNTTSELAGFFDTIPAKTLFSAHETIHIPSELSQVVIIGMEVHVCVLQTVSHLLNLGKKVFVVADAIASANLFDAQLGIERMRFWGAEIVTKQMLFFEWLRDAKHPQFKTLSKQFLK